MNTNIFHLEITKTPQGATPSWHRSAKAGKCAGGGWHYIIFNFPKMIDKFLRSCFVMQKFIKISSAFIIAISCAASACATGSQTSTKIVNADSALIPNEADIAWANLCAQVKNLAPERKYTRTDSAAPLPMPASASPQRTTAPAAPKDADYGQAVSHAREFQAKHPGDPRAQEARKIEMMSLLKQQRTSGKKLQPLDDASIDNYIKDPKISAVDRYDTSAFAKEVRLDYLNIKTADNTRALRAQHARELTQEFSQDPRGYGYLLAVARSLPAIQATEIAHALLAGGAPEKTKNGARSLLAQKDMEGKSLHIDGLNLEDCKGRPVVIYTWTKRHPDIFEFLIDLSGRGLLGFHSFVTLDHQTNLFKYQFLTQSYPMTGLAMREQTYRFWKNGSQVNFRLVTSHDNTVVFDEVVNPSNNIAWGTVYPFISKAIESRWEDASTAHYTLASAASSSQPETIFTRQKPAGAHITISAESKFDNQTDVQITLPGAYNPSDLAASGTNTVTGYPNYDDFLALTFPQKITHGNLTSLATDFGDGFWEKVATTYKPPTSNGITGLVDTITTTVESSDFDIETAPVKSYAYWSNNSTPTALVASENTDATDNTLDLTTTYTRDNLGRVTATTIAGYDSPGNPKYIGSYITSSAIAFDTRFDLPATTLNTYEHATITAYHATFGLPVSTTDANGIRITTAYDALGRAIETRNEMLGLQTNTEYSWTSSSNTDWRKQQTVAPPAGVGGLTLTSVFAIRTTETVKPAVIAYCDHRGRVIRTIKEGFRQRVITDTIYNNIGQVTATSLPYLSGSTPLWTKTTYDPLGRIASVTAPNGTVTTNTYTGRVTAVTVKATDREAQTNVTLVDARGRTIKVWNADNVPALNPATSTFDLNSTTASIEYKLDGFGRMRKTIIREQTQHIDATYDALGRQITLNDPDKGLWHYVNNALGQVVGQTDANGNVTTSAFDRLGRPLIRTTAEPLSGPVETARWYYFDLSDNAERHAVAKDNKGWIGALQREESAITGAPGYATLAPVTTTVFYYDVKGRPEITLRSIDGKWFYTHTAYDAASRISQLNHYWRPASDETGTVDPYAWESFGCVYAYDSLSYLLKLTDTTPESRIWWEVDATSGYDHLDRPVLVRKDNAHWTQRTYRPEDGVITSIKTGPAVGGTSIQNLDYDYDGLGNLTSRVNGSLTETFGYDNLNRLTTRNGSVIATYAINGNITGKIDVSGNASGSYTYSATKPHAVTGAWGCMMSYDANGNLATRAGNGQTWTTNWTGFDKPRWLAKTGGVPSEATTTTMGSEFLYNANRSRVMHLEFDAMTNNAPLHYTRKKIYAAGPDVEIDYANTAPANAFPSWQRQTVRVYLNAPDGPVGAAEFTSTSTPNLNSPTPDKALVYHTDHLGSIESITDYGDTSANLALDDTGKPSRYSYDPWGERRNPGTWSGTPTTTDPGGPDGTASRGFTGHEMMDGLGLVHMNGRIYDPLVGRMLSADPIVQYPGDLQSYNRYGYVRNNPLVRIDPSGYADINLLDTNDIAYNYGEAIPRNIEGVTTIVMHGDGGTQFMDNRLPDKMQTVTFDDIRFGLENSNHLDGDIIHVYACDGAIGANLDDLKKLAVYAKSPVVAANNIVELRKNTITGAFTGSRVQGLFGRWKIIMPDGSVRTWITPERNLKNAQSALKDARAAESTAKQKADIAQSRAASARSKANTERDKVNNASANDKAKAERKANKADEAAVKAEAKAQEAKTKQEEAEKAAQEAARKEREAEELARRRII
jgi:RHS repeat-associated protein